MKEIYRKTSIFSFIGGIGMLIFCTFYYFYIYESFTVNGEVLFEVGLLALISIGSGFYFKHAHEKLNNGPIDSTDRILSLENLNELNLQRVPSLLPKIVHVDSNGNPMVTIESSKGRLSRGFTFFELFEKGFLIPVHYDISDMNGQPIATFTIKNNVRRSELILKKPDGTVLGTYIQLLSKSALKNRGVLYHADGSVWRELEAKSIAGDIDVKDGEGKMTARYRYGIFPYAMNPAFVSTAHHEHVRFGTHISSNEKLAYAMLFFFWLKG